MDDQAQKFPYSTGVNSQRWLVKNDNFRGFDQDIRQVRFAGVHADIGGGYPETESGLSKFPLLWMIDTSLKPQAELFHIPPTLIPSSVTLEHYVRVLTETPFLLAQFAVLVVLALLAVLAMTRVDVTRLNEAGRPPSDPDRRVREDF